MKKRNITQNIKMTTRLVSCTKHVLEPKDTTRIYLVAIEFLTIARRGFFSFIALLPRRDYYV